MHEKAPRFLYSVHFSCWALSSRGETFIYPLYYLNKMTKVDQLAATLKQLTPRQLQQLMTRTSTVDGSTIKAKKIRATEKYFEHAPKPHHCLTYGVYSDTVDYIHEIGIDKWLSQKVNNQTKNATFVTVRKQ